MRSDQTRPQPAPPGRTGRITQPTWADAERFTPGGVHSSLRRVDPQLVVTRAEGAWIEAADGTRFVDYHAAFGPIVLGHRHPSVEAAVREALDRIDLTGIGVTDLEIEAARRIVEHVPSADQVLFTNSGSEATYAAIRLARAVTGRRKLIKFQGCYHGWHDAVALNVISTRDKLGTIDPLSAGSSSHELADTIVCRFNDLEDVRAAFERNTGDVAAMILEPIPHNVGALLPEPGFLEGLRELASLNGTLLIFDEVITGVRHGLGGYQDIAGVLPDLTCLGKAVANGYPAAALAGPETLMREFGTAGGSVFFAGTFNGHPSAMAAICATIDVLASGEVLAGMFDRGQRARSELECLARGHGLEATACGYGSVFVLYFLDRQPRNFDELLDNDAERYVGFHAGMVDRGHFMLPMNLKRNNVSAAHTDADIDRLLEDADTVLKGLASRV